MAKRRCAGRKGLSINNRVGGRILRPGDSGAESQCTRLHACWTKQASNCATERFVRFWTREGGGCLLRLRRDLPDGAAAVARITGIARSTIIRGLAEIT